MLTLRNAIAARLGAFWVQTHDVHRVVECVVENSNNDTYMFDPFKGLSLYKDGKWLVVTVQNPNEPEEIMTIADPMMAFGYVVDRKGTFIITAAETVAEDLYGSVLGLAGMHRKAFFSDNVDELGASVIFVSTSDEVPPIYGRNMPVVSMPLPTSEDIKRIYSNVERFNPAAVGNDENAAKLVPCSVGLSENEILSASLEMIASSGEINAETMNELRTAYLKSNASIDLIRPGVTFDSLGGLDNAKKIIADSARIFADPSSDAKVRNKYLLIGVPGCGKSAICEAAAAELKMNLARTGVTQQMSKWVGESERNMRQTLASINAMAPIAVWIEEIGRDLSGGGTSNDSGTTDRVQGLLLTGLQEMGDNIFLFATANRVDGLAPEILRQGRFDEILFVGFPSQAEREDILSIYLTKNDFDVANFNIPGLAAMTEGFTGAEIESVVNKLAFQYHSDGVELGTESLSALIGESTNLMITRHHGEMLTMYQRAVKEWTWASSQQRLDAQRFLDGDFGPAKNIAAAPKKRASVL